MKELAVETQTWFDPHDNEKDTESVQGVPVQWVGCGGESRVQEHTQNNTLEIPVIDEESRCNKQDI